MKTLSQKYALNDQGKGVFEVTIGSSDTYWENKEVYNEAEVLFLGYGADGSLCTCYEMSMDTTNIEQDYLSCDTVEKEVYATWADAGFKATK
ncbi:MAG TPA: hypothetical protein EYN66_03965 [Myxococcales bacterium]|nr:hypothetical protein [Myxococcales bacterium]